MIIMIIIIPKEYTKKSKERLITAANGSNNNRINLKTKRKPTNKKTRKQKWEEK